MPERAALVPDTLELAGHGRLAINGVLGSCDLDRDFEPYFRTFFDVHPAYMFHWSGLVSGVLPKYVEALPLLRLMSGSDEHQDLEACMLATVVDNTAGDGLIYDRVRPDRPWHTGVGYGVKGWSEDYACLAGNGRLLRGLLHYYRASGDDVWRERAKRTAERLHALAVVKDDYAYYPNVGLGNDFSYPRQSGWVHTKEPQSDFEGSEGVMMFYQLQPVRGFTRWYTLTGDERFLHLSQQFVNFGRQRKFWGGAHDVEPQACAERGHFYGHFHGRTAALIGLLDYAVAADDWQLKLFVRDSYEWARHHGIHRLGVFPSQTGVTEGCTVADMVALAVMLSDAGAGDYWDDVDQYARNGLLATQTSDRDELERVSQAGPERPDNAPWGGNGDMRFEGWGGVLPGQETTDRVIERTIGAFGLLQGARFVISRLMHCCTGNGAQALYYAWEGIVRQSGDSAQVNLWLNRRSPWLDVWSWLPYEGRLAVYNKKARRIAVRLPGWASPASLRCTLNGSDVRPEWIGNRVVFDGLTGGEALCLEVPVSEDKTPYTVANLNHRTAMAAADQYDCTFKGNTVISVGEEGADPGGRDLVSYRIFQREHLRAAETPMKKMPVYVHREPVIRW